MVTDFSTLVEIVNDWNIGNDRLVRVKHSMNFVYINCLK